MSEYEYEISSNNYSVDFGATGISEILQNVLTLITTIKGTVSFNRDIGIEESIIDAATPIAQAKLTAQIIDVIEKYEPRCEVLSVNIYKDEQQGILIPKVKVRIYDEYL